MSICYKWFKENQSEESEDNDSDTSEKKRKKRKIKRKIKRKDVIGSAFTLNKSLCFIVEFEKTNNLTLYLKQ